nr:sensor histidine kinase [Hymenobacter ruricola]
MDAVHLFGYRYNPATGPWIVGSVLLVNVLVVVLFELLLALNQWQTNQLGAERLEHEQLQGQLDEVKQQISPHFLFNSLNSLSVLIGEDPRQAERFVDEMAKVYRYLLQSHRGGEPLAGHPGLTTLEAELRYLASYAHLLRTRYGAALELSIAADVAEGHRQGGLLPLTLQTLVDNALRHNVASAARPLRIAVDTTPAGQVRVRNTRQKRTVRVPLPQDNLAALQARYQRLGPGGPAVEVAAGEEYFTVSIHLAGCRTPQLATQ